MRLILTKANTFLLALFISLTGINSIKAQSINFNYAKQIGNSGADVGRSVITDSNGNVYTTGYFNGVGDFDPGIGTFTLSSYGLEDVFVTKFDAFGNFVWAKQIGGSIDERGYSISLDGLGNIYLAGIFAGTVDFDPSATVFALTSVGGTQEDAFFVKLDPSGNFIWAKQIGGSSADYSYSMVADASGNVYSTGSFQGTADFDPSASTYTLTSTSQQPFILKLNTVGNFVWAKTFNNITGTGCIGEGITIDVSGNVYTTGYFDGSVDFDPSAVTSTLTASPGASDVFISKLDNSGNHIWAKSFSGSSFTEGTSIAVDGGGNVYTTGIFGNTVDFDPGALTFNLTSGGIRNVFISKLNSSGNFVWAKKIGGTSSDDRGYSIVLDGTTNVYVAGSFNGTVDFDPGASTFNITSLSADNDIYVTKLDGSGNFMWAKAMQGTLDDKAWAVALDNNGSVYLTGSFNGTVDFDPNVTTYTLTNPSVSGIPDIFICKLSCQAPTITAVSSSSVMCTGKSATLTASGANTYTWYPVGTGASIVVSPTVTSTYTVTGTNTLGCSGSNTVALNVVNNPTVSAISSSSIICAGETATLTASGALTYTWSPLANGNSIIISPTVTTNYTVNGTDNNGCVNTSTLSQVVSPCIGINELSYSEVISIFPNPSSGRVVITLKNASNEAQFLLHNCMGQILINNQIKDSTTEFNFQNFTNGIYFFTVIDNNNRVYNGKIIIQQ